MVEVRGSDAEGEDANGRIRMVEVADGAVHKIAHAVEGEPDGLTFSPDGRWLAWSQPRGERSAALVLARLDDGLPTGDLVQATGGRFRDFSPAFTADGCYLTFLSTRTFDPVYDVHSFEMTFLSGTRPYLMPLAADDPVPFGPSVTGWGFVPADAPTEGGGGGSAGDGLARGAPTPEVLAPVRTQVDVEGLEERIVAFPVVAGQYERLRAAGDAVLWLRRSPSARHPRPWSSPNSSLTRAWRAFPTRAPEFPWLAGQIFSPGRTGSPERRWHW